MDFLNDTPSFPDNIENQNSVTDPVIKRERDGHSKRGVPYVEKTEFLLRTPTTGRSLKEEGFSQKKTSQSKDRKVNKD